MEMIWGQLPQNQKNLKMQLMFSSDQDGYSLKRVYNKCIDYIGYGYVVVVKESNGTVFGGYSDSMLGVQGQKFRGTSVSFVFQVEPEVIFYQGQEDCYMFQYCDQEYFFLGSGEADSMYNNYLILIGAVVLL